MCPTIQSADRNPFQFFSAQFAVISETVKWLGVPIYITNNRYVRQRTPRKVWPKLVCWWNRCQDIWPWYYLSQTINHNGNLAACRWNHKRDFVSPSWTPHTSAISRDAFSLGTATPESCLCSWLTSGKGCPYIARKAALFTVGGCTVNQHIGWQCNGYIPKKVIWWSLAGYCLNGHRSLAFAYHPCFVGRESPTNADKIDSKIGLSG